MLVNQRFAYVSVSRGKYDAQIYTDIKNEVARGLSRDLARPTAIHTEGLTEVGQSEESKVAHRRAHEEEHEQAHGIGLGGAGDVGFQDDLQPLRGEQPIGQVLEHHAVERGHGDAASRTERLALLRTAGAGVIAIASALASAQRHARAAGATARDPGQQCRAPDQARRHALGAA